MAGADAVLTCRDCGAPFALDDDERQTLASQGHVHPPSRCAGCRQARKRRQAASGARPVAPGFRELRQTRTIIACSACGASAEVPFMARGDRPVFCSACFERRRREAPGT